MSKKIKQEYTYCNPLAIPNIPRGKDEWYPTEHGMFSHENKPDFVKTPDYRTISDPTVFYWDNKWYLYPSYGMAWVSEDFIHWEHHRTEPYCPKYSPHIIPWKDGKFLLTAWYSPLYEADDPLGPFKLLGDFIKQDGTLFTPCDPGIFKDDDGRIYLYEVSDTGKGCTIIGYELDKDNPCQVIAGPELIVEMDPVHKEWERQGRHHQNFAYGWVEGPHLLKYNGRYYMIYATPDTRDAQYVNAVYYSDVSPLKAFQPQKKNPLTSHQTGIVTGAGHGTVERGPNGTLWVFYTVACGYLHCYERRIGMDYVTVDENGELICPFGVTDTPQISPLYLDDPDKNGTDFGYYNLTGAVRPIASSNAPGRDAVYATDENNLSFWQPADDDESPTIECNLEWPYNVGAVRLFWREIGLDYKNGIVPAPVDYVLEGCLDDEWFVLLDKSKNTEDKNVDYQTFPERSCKKVRLRIVGHGKGLKMGLIDFAVFGKMDEKDYFIKK